MRRLRITVVAAAIACVVGALASPALAAEPSKKPKAFFGEFTASIPTSGPITEATPAVAKTKEGTLDAFTVGNPNHPLFKFECESLRSEGKVTSERSTSFKTEVKFHKCKGARRLAENIVEGEEVVKGQEILKLSTKFGPGFEMEFHANGAVGVGSEIEADNEARITKGTDVEIKIKGALCKIVVPPQTVPKNGLNEEHEFESAEYSGEREETNHLKLYPSGFKETVSEIDWFLPKLIVEIPVGPGTGCHYEREPGGKFNEATDSVVEKANFEGELEAIEIKKGEFFFESAQEHKEKEV
jgi:hypothetical protein